ncbi:MAG: S-layer homology domain-containing protein [Clostridia bacterium]|nr:S-layer homology domain-containing protein [Clostridia bacterium]
MNRRKKPWMIALLVMALAAGPVLAGGYYDVAPDSEEGQAVEALTREGVVTGYPDGGFHPDDPFTREEFAQILFRLLDGKQGEVSLAPFDDVEAERWSAPAIAWARRVGAVNGRDDGLFWPIDPVSRAEALKMLLTSTGLAQNDLTFPEGYLRRAAELELLPDDENEATRGSIARIVWRCLQVLERQKEAQEPALVLGEENGRLRLMLADGTTVALRPAAGIMLPEQAAGKLFVCSREGDTLLSLMPAEQAEGGLDAASLATQLSNITYELKLGDPEAPTLSARVTEKTVIFLRMGVEGADLGYAAVDRSCLPMINGGSGVSTCRVLSCVEKEGEISAMLLAAPGNPAWKGTVYGLLRDASLVGTGGRHRYLIRMVAAGREMTLLTAAVSQGKPQFATPPETDQELLLRGSAYLRLHIGEDGAADQIARISAEAEQTPRLVRGLVTALPGNRGIAVSQDFTLEDGRLIPGENLLENSEIYFLNASAAVYLVDGLPEEAGPDGLLMPEEEAAVSVGDLTDIRKSSADGENVSLADLLLVKNKNGEEVIAVFCYEG